MRALAILRSRRVLVEMTEDGQIRLRGHGPEDVELARDNKAQILEALRLERLYDVEYLDSPYPVWIDDLYCKAKRAAAFQVIGPECVSLMALCNKLEDAMQSGVQSAPIVAEIQETAERAAVKSGWLLEGNRLRDAVAEMAREMSRPALDMGALE